MRNIAIFLAAVLLGALPVVGQDDANTKLKQQIDALLRELKAHQAPARRDGEVLVQKIYDVSDLLAWDQRDEWTRNVPLTDQASSAGETDCEPTCQLSVDVIVELIRLTVYPTSWDSFEGVDIQPKRTSLFVNTLPTVHAGIKRLLRTLRRSTLGGTTVEVVAIEASAELLALVEKHAGALPAAAAQRLWAAPRLGSVGVVTNPAWILQRRNGTAREYNAGFNVRVAESSTAADPIRHTLLDGCSVLVRASPASDGKHVVVDITVEQTKTNMTKHVEFSYGRLTLPSQRVTRLGAAAWMASGETRAIGGGIDGDGSCIFLVRATNRQ